MIPISVYSKYLIVETKKNLTQEDIETVKQYVKTYYVKYDWAAPEVFDKSFFSRINF